MFDQLRDDEMMRWCLVWQGLLRLVLVCVMDMSSKDRFNLITAKSVGYVFWGQTNTCWHESFHQEIQKSSPINCHETSSFNVSRENRYVTWFSQRWFSCPFLKFFFQILGKLYVTVNILRIACHDLLWKIKCDSQYTQNSLKMILTNDADTYKYFFLHTWNPLMTLVLIGSLGLVLEGWSSPTNRGLP